MRRFSSLRYCKYVRPEYAEILWKKYTFLFVILFEYFFSIFITDISYSLGIKYAFHFDNVREVSLVRFTNFATALYV
jgi:hypothetical protein